MKRFIAIALSIAAQLCAAPAGAATFCVSTVTELFNALNYYDITAGSDETVTIRVTQGTYAVGNTLTKMFGAHTEEGAALKLLGGYTAGCASRQPDPRNTVLDAGDAPGSGIGLMMKGDGGLLVEALTFTRFTGATTLTTGGGVNLSQGEALLITDDSFSDGDESLYEVRQCRFIRNAGQSIVNMSGAQQRFINNVVADSTLVATSPGNIQVGAVVFTLDGDEDAAVAATNNTITGTTGGPAMRVGTLITSSSGRISEVSGNILWNNASFDIVFAVDPEFIYPLLSSYNLYNSANASFPQAATDLHVDPRFINAAAGNYRLASNSPAINRGPFAQLHGFPVRDADGATRIVGSRVDIGAYESTIDDATTAIVTSAGDNGSNASPTPGSLRAAIKTANAASGPFAIRFNINGGCPRLLGLSAPMLDITGDVTIDGTTQPGWTPNDRFGEFNGNLCLFLNGTGSPWALHVPSTAPSTARLVVRGLGFAGFTDAAIKLEGGSNHRIWGSQFGAIPLTVANRNAIRVTGNSGGAIVGGYDDEGAVNLFAGSSAEAIYLDNAAGGSTIANNVIGFLPDGTGASANASGVLAFNAKNNVVQYNYIGNSSANAIVLSGAASSGNRVQYNTIGIDVAGNVASNGGAGVLVNFGAKNNTIGAPLNAMWGGNAIAGSGGPGVWISASGAGGNSVLDNSIQGSGGLDIDLAQAGPSANQPGSSSSGPNNLQNYPVLTSALRGITGGGVETVRGTLAGAPNTTYRIDIFYAFACSTAAPGRGLALYPLTKAAFATGAQGAASFTVVVPFGLPGVPLGGISATVTDPFGNTSEIGNCVAEIPDDTIFRDGFN